MKRMTNGQIEALKMFITSSKEASVIAKKVAILLIEESNNLTQFVRMPLDNYNRYKDSILAGIHDMNSTGYRTRLDLFLEGMGTQTWLYGHSDGVSLTDSSCKSQGPEFKTIKFDKKRIDAVELPKDH